MIWSPIGAALAALRLPLAPNLFLAAPASRRSGPRQLNLPPGPSAAARVAPLPSGRTSRGAPGALDKQARGGRPASGQGARREEEEEEEEEEVPKSTGGLCQSIERPTNAPKHSPLTQLGPLAPACIAMCTVHCNVRWTKMCAALQWTKMCTAYCPWRPQCAPLHSIGLAAAAAAAAATRAGNRKRSGGDRNEPDDPSSGDLLFANLDSMLAAGDSSAGSMQNHQLAGHLSPGAALTLCASDGRPLAGPHPLRRAFTLPAGLSTSCGPPLVPPPSQPEGAGPSSDPQPAGDAPTVATSGPQEPSGSRRARLDAGSLAHLATPVKTRAGALSPRHTRSGEYQARGAGKWATSGLAERPSWRGERSCPLGG